MDFGPAGQFHMRLCLALKTAGMDLPMSYLLLGVIINTFALINLNTANFILDARAIADILSLKQEISLLCIYYDINILLQFESLKLISNNLKRDCKALGINRKALVKKNKLSEKDIQSLDESHTLLRFLALVRYFMADPNTEVGLLIADFNRSSLVYLPHDTVRKPGVGLRVTRRRPVSSVWTLNGQGFEMCTPPGSSPASTPMREIPNARPRFNPFKSKPMSTRPALNRMDLDDENSPAVLSNAPLRMRRNKRFRLGRF
ncbi:hypothetical protein BN14_02481 [Rhizoctonia solani AG-1 IB]|uniref:Uncharacterized protein n=1 Tax=Thanatephorus cucumeris (strain AG1-IB / isolate 7/3/14) TaxID=1108050 RepID=M5BNC2_THACB|nr:hypothetical protein BN14_02481 [Rhizoctonia solani AG-1 IB]